MLDIAAQLGSTWGGDAANAYYAKLRGLQADMNKLHNMINEHVTDLNEMAREYEDKERAAVEAANALKTDMIV